MKRSKLVSFNVCPFVQRSLIVLEEKRVRENYDIRKIDLDAKPDLFLRHSPVGQVPILIVGDTVLFESAAINEYSGPRRGIPCTIRHAGRRPVRRIAGIHINGRRLLPVGSSASRKPQ